MCIVKSKMPQLYCIFFLYFILSLFLFLFQFRHRWACFIWCKKKKSVKVWTPLNLKKQGYNPTVIVLPADSISFCHLRVGWSSCPLMKPRLLQQQDTPLHRDLVSDLPNQDVVRVAEHVCSISETSSFPVQQGGNPYSHCSTATVQNQSENHNQTKPVSTKRTRTSWSRATLLWKLECKPHQDVTVMEPVCCHRNIICCRGNS